MLPRTWKASLTNWSTQQEPLSSTPTCRASGSSCSQTARKPSKRSSRSRQPRKLHSVPNSSKSDESSFWKRAGDRARRGQQTERPGSSIKGGTRQSVPAGHPRPIWSRFLPDVCRKVTRQGEKRSPAALPGFPNSACTSHILCSWSTRPWECKRNHEQPRPKADSDVVSQSRLELARKQAFENFISIDGEAQVLDTIFSREERQRRRKRYHASFRSVGDCHELLSTNICFLQRVPESPWKWGNTGVIQNVCQWVRGALCGKRPGPRQQESTSQNWRQRAQNCCLQLETTGARSPGLRRMGGPSS